MEFILKYKKYFIIISMIISFLIIILISYYNNKNNLKKEIITTDLISKNEKEVEEKNENNQEIKEEVKTFYVDIKGQVNNPGVYLVNENNIVNDVINLANGLNNYADTKCINLSKKVSEEMVIYVYSKTETKQIINKQKEIKTSDEVVCNNIVNNAFQNPNNNTQTTTTNNEEKIENDNNNQLININTADLNTLTTLSGIGSSKAQDIIDYRNKNGPFKSIEDLKNVNGIGDSTFEKIKNNITI